jgi:protein-L-isoaspartate O-methyltransferase
MSINWSSYIDTHDYYDESLLTEIIGRYIKFFKVYNIKSKKMSVLEIGAGHGINTMIFTKLFKNILASEPNEILMNGLNGVIKKQKISNVKTILTSVEAFKSKKIFHMIVCANSFLFIKNKPKSLLNFSKLLKSSGYLLIIEPFKFMVFNGEKNRAQMKMMESIESVVKSSKFKMIYYGIITKGQLCYLLQKR